MNDAIAFSFDPHDYNADPVEIAYRNALGDGLERVLGQGADTLADLARGLNAIDVTDRGGKTWTEDSLQDELRRLAW
ncbi:recombinase-like helix-turn-helix domain-containing protein [Novosphingobium album (ex Liu et al. 2023)]|uniref:Recombinase-like domain-containing protein n=1 Tax=Novosphingobium album (ex Liu et al. 2023) TaxID=3031130 RepID=A0ABT5WNA8_9SPHN|nr:recombinase-like helix-turn-helix domain-containing protein [Novosphingobium album (ex Liu et al. 2023)]MDE8651525.1 hypothetical protein [Novosphingobium album (ex Liu et al. 2023)]